MKIRDFIPNAESNPLFCQTSDETLSKYLSEDTWHIARFSTGEVIYSYELSTQNGIHVGIIASGSATVHTSNQHSGDHALLRSLKVGDMFGIANLYAEDEPFPSTIIAAEVCEILFIDAGAFKKWIENDRTALKKYLTFQSRRIVYLNRKIITYTATSAEKKLALYLLEQEQNGYVCLPCSMSQLAQLLDIGRASLYRSLDRLIERGFVEKKGDGFQIVDRTVITLLN